MDTDTFLKKKYSFYNVSKHDEGLYSLFQSDLLSHPPSNGAINVLQRIHKEVKNLGEVLGPPDILSRVIFSPRVLSQNNRVVCAEVCVCFHAL